MTTKEKYKKQVREMFDVIDEKDNENIEKAARVIADAVASKHAVYIFDTGHLINQELIGRVGGFLFIHKFAYGINVEAEAFERETPKKSIAGLAKIALNNGGVLPGDVMILGSVSGKTENVIDLALACKEMGVHTIGITSVGYSSQLEPLHPSGKRLYEVADITLDNCSPYGDSMVEVPGLDCNFGPSSGLNAAYIMWCICADTLDYLMKDHNITPRVFRSVNVPEFAKENDKKREEYKKEGY